MTSKVLENSKKNRPKKKKNLTKRLHVGKEPIPLKYQ